MAVKTMKGTTMKRSEKRIQSEVTALLEALNKPNRWNERARNTIKKTISVLESRYTLKDVEREFYQDETSADYQEGDNELYHELCRVVDWMEGKPHSIAPSAGL
jgi:hypothetical protein